MATSTVRICDIFGGKQDVRRYTVIVIQIEPEPPADAKNEDAEVYQQIDLCPRALERLKKYVLRGLSRPNEPQGKVMIDRV